MNKGYEVLGLAFNEEKNLWSTVVKLTDPDGNEKYARFANGYVYKNSTDVAKLFANKAAIVIKPASATLKSIVKEAIDSKKFYKSNSDKRLSMVVINGDIVEDVQ